MKICKSDKSIVSFNRNKIIQTCMTAGSDIRLATQIAKEVKGEGYEGMTTDEIRMRVYIKLKKINTDVAERYVYRSNMKVRTSSALLEYFQANKIVDSLVAETKVNQSFSEKIAKDVEKELGRMRLDYVTAPLIREIVNVKLLEKGMESVRARYTRLGMPVYDVKLLLEQGSHDIAQYSPEAVHKVMSDQIAREYALINVLPFDLADAHMSGQIHIHDLNYFPLRPTTFSHDLRFFLRRGLKVDGTGEYTAVSGPAKKPSAAFMHALKVLIAGQTECSREQYIEDFNVILAPYVSGLDYTQVKQLIQMLFYEISQTSVGKGGQAIYAALEVDNAMPQHLKDVAAVQPGGRVQKTTTYADFTDEADKIFNAVMDVSLEGDYINKPFIYPKLIVNLANRKDDEKLQKVAKLVDKYGTPYLFNGKRHFYGLRRGTIQHVSINLPQIGYQKGKDIFQVLDNRMKKAQEVLLLKKKVMEKNLEHNLLPFLKQKAAGLRYFSPEKQQYVISYVGLNELALQQTGHDLTSKEGQMFGTKVVKFMMKMRDTFADESGLDFILTGDPKGLPYTKFAEVDVQRYGDQAVHRDGKTPYYSKSHYVNPKKLSEKLSVEGRFNNIVNGRTTTHIRLGGGGYDSEDMVRFLKKICFRDDVRYLSISRGLTLCAKCGYTQYGKAGKCSKCNSRGVSVWARDTGHIQNIKVWNTSQIQAYVDEYRYDLKGHGVELSAKQKKVVMKTVR